MDEHQDEKIALYQQIRNKSALISTLQATMEDIYSRYRQEKDKFEKEDLARDYHRIEARLFSAISDLNSYRQNLQDLNAQSK
jgi:hypothetical protein